MNDSQSTAAGVGAGAEDECSNSGSGNSNNNGNAMQDMNVYLSMKYSSPLNSKGSKDGDEDFGSNNMVTTVI